MMCRPRLFGSVLLLVLMTVGLACSGEPAVQERTGEEPVRTPPEEPDESADATRPSFETYANERFGFSVAYPASMLTEANRSQNGDGIVLTSASGDVTLRTSASHNATDATMTHMLESARDDFEHVSSEEGRQDYAVLRGTGPGGHRLVERVELHDGDLFSLELSYPPSALADSTVERVVSSFDVAARDEPTGRLVEVALLDYAAADGRYERESDGEQRGCDRVVLVERNVPQTRAPLTAALQELFSLDQASVDGWQNFIAETNETLAFERAAVQQGTASIYLSGELSGLGGVCDDPRARIQIEETALQFSTVDSVAIYLNGQRTDLQPDARGR